MFLASCNRAASACVVFGRHGFSQLIALGRRRFGIGIQVAVRRGQVIGLLGGRRQARLAGLRHRQIIHLRLGALYARRAPLRAAYVRR